MINPVYAGAYTYGKTQQERYVDQAGRLKKRIRHLPRSKWAVLIHDHHKGFIDWETYEMNQSRIAKNTRPLPHQAAGSIREGAALLQGIAKCGRCGRNLRVYYQGRHSTPRLLLRCQQYLQRQRNVLSTRRWSANRYSGCPRLP